MMLYLQNKQETWMATCRIPLVSLNITSGSPLCIRDTPSWMHICIGFGGYIRTLKSALQYVAALYPNVLVNVSLSFTPAHCHWLNTTSIHLLNYAPTDAICSLDNWIGISFPGHLEETVSVLQQTLLVSQKAFFHLLVEAGFATLYKSNNHFLCPTHLEHSWLDCSSISVSNKKIPLNYTTHECMHLPATFISSWVCLWWIIEAISKISRVHHKGMFMQPSVSKPT